MPSFRVELRTDDEEEHVITLVDNENHVSYALSSYADLAAAEADAASIREWANDLLTFGHQSWSEGESVG